MKLDKKRLVWQRDRSASMFDQYATIPKQMAHRLIRDLKQQIPKARKILELGSGTGYLTGLLLEHYPQAEVVAIDWSEKMVQQASQTLPPNDRVLFLIGDLENMNFSQWAPYDLIVSNGVFHWLDTPERSLRKWLDLLVGGGWMYATMYGPETFQEWRQLYQLVEERMGYIPTQEGISLRSADGWEELFQKVKEIDVTTREIWIRQGFSDCRSFLQSVKAVGDSYSDNPYNLIVQRRILLEAMRRYNSAYRMREGVYATYHLIELKAMKRERRPKQFLSSQI